MANSLADIAERLMAEFEGRCAPNVVSDVVRGAAQDLTGTPAGAWDELVERAARQRLLELG
jgi:hypothetical protein